MPARSPSHTVALGGGRVAALDEAGDPAGVPVLYLHGTPDSRLARHPDDGLAATAGVRLLALDRPGYGRSSAPASRWSPDWPAAAAADADAVLGALGVERCAVLAWSGGALTGLALAAGAGRVAALGVVSGLVPREAYDDPAIAAAAPDRLGMLELAAGLPPGELGADVAPLLAPHPCDPALAAEHQAGLREPHDAAELATVPGATERMADALVEAVRGGLAGVAFDVESQARPLGLDLAAVEKPVRLWYGARDTVTPPAFGRWYAARLPHAELEVVDGASHYLVFTAWQRLLGELAALAA